MADKDFRLITPRGEDIRSQSWYWELTDELIQAFLKAKRERKVLKGHIIGTPREPKGYRIIWEFTVQEERMLKLSNGIE